MKYNNPLVNSVPWYMIGCTGGGHPTTQSYNPFRGLKLIYFFLLFMVLGAVTYTWIMFALRTYSHLAFKYTYTPIVHKIELCEGEKKVKFSSWMQTPS